jgi:phage portal protein BeeE
LNPIELFREALALGLACEEYSARLFGNCAYLEAVLETPQAIGDMAPKCFREMWKQNYGDQPSSPKIAILDRPSIKNLTK